MNKLFKQQIYLLNGVFVYRFPECMQASQKVWTQVGNKGNQWLQGQFLIPRQAALYQIYIEGIVVPPTLVTSPSTTYSSHSLHVDVS